MTTRDLGVIAAIVLVLVIGFKVYRSLGSDEELVLLAYDKIEEWVVDDNGMLVYPSVRFQVLEPPENGVILRVAGSVVDQQGINDVVRFLEESDPVLRPDEYLLEVAVGLEGASAAQGQAVGAGALNGVALGAASAIPGANPFQKTPRGTSTRSSVNPDMPFDNNLIFNRGPGSDRYKKKRAVKSRPKSQLDSILSSMGGAPGKR